MELYSADASPYARKVRVVISELGLSDQVTVHSVAGSPLNSGDIPLAVNPLGKIPCLVRADGPALFDSRVITRYLNDRARGALYPDGAREWQAATLEAMGDGMMDAALLAVYETRLRSGDQVMQEMIEGQFAKITRACAMLEERWMSYLAGPVDIAHIAIASALSYVDFRLGDRDWQSSYPDLAKWFQEMDARPSFEQTRPV